MKSRKSPRELIFIIAILVFVFALAEITFRILIFPDWRSVGQATFLFHPIYGTFQKPNLDVRRYNPPNYDVRNRTNSLAEWGTRTSVAWADWEMRARAPRAPAARATWMSSALASLARGKILSRLKAKHTALTPAEDRASPSSHHRWFRNHQ